MTGNLKVLLNYQKATSYFHGIEFGFLIIDSICAWKPFNSNFMHECTHAVDMGVQDTKQTEQTDWFQTVSLVIMVHFDAYWGKNKIKSTYDIDSVKV